MIEVITHNTLRVPAVFYPFKHSVQLSPGRGLLTARKRPNQGMSWLFDDEVLRSSGIPTTPIAANMLHTEISANMHIPKAIVATVPTATMDKLIRKLTLVNLSVSESVVSTDNSVTALSEIVIFLNFTAGAVDKGVSRELPGGIVTFPNAFIISKYRRID